MPEDDLLLLEAVLRWAGVPVPPGGLREVEPIGRALRERFARLDTVPVEDVEPAFIAPLVPPPKKPGR
jgi:hypothetical protein